MRSLLACVLLAGCTDAAEVPTTVAHVHLTLTCSGAATDCNAYADALSGDCGSTAALITTSTHELTVVTASDAEDIAGYVQLQYTADPPPVGADETSHLDQVLAHDEKNDVYAAYDYALLYRITAAGDVIDVDPTKLSAASGNMLQFAYTLADGLSVVEDHVIDAPRPLRIETDDPGLMDACCAVGRPQDIGLVVLAIGFVVRTRRRARVGRA